MAHTSKDHQHKSKSGHVGHVVSLERGKTNKKTNKQNRHVDRPGYD